jgi:hypothetical protein
VGCRGGAGGVCSLKDAADTSKAAAAAVAVDRASLMCACTEHFSCTEGSRGWRQTQSRVYAE